MWQESTYPRPADTAELARTIKATIHQFDRSIFWRNARDYSAGGVTLMVFAAAAVSHSPYVPLPLFGMAAVAFFLGYLGWKHRDVHDPDPLADARAYQAALLARFDRQVRLLRNARYWYFLPLYLWILGATVVNLLHRPARVSPWAHAVGLVAGLGIVTAVFIWLARFNERYAVRLISEAKKEAESLLSEWVEDQRP